MMRDILILVVVLLILLTVVSAFGGSLRHTPALSPEGFYGYSERFEEPDAPAGSQPVSSKVEAEAAAVAAMKEAGVSAGMAPDASVAAVDDANASPTAAACDLLRRKKPAALPAGPSPAAAAAAAAATPATAGSATASAEAAAATKPIEAFQPDGAYATW
jgi:hypothetical protein